MSERFIRSETWMRHRINVEVYLPVPGIMNKEEAPAMGNSPLERDENIMKFVEEMWLPQYLRAVKGIIETYEKSEAPIRFIEDQPISLIPLPMGEYAMLGHDGSIIIDNDTACGSKKVGPGAHVFGVMVAQKMLIYKGTREAFESIRRIVPNIDEISATFLYAELFGEVVCGQSTPNLCWMDETCKNYLKREVLRIAWQ